MSIADQTAGSVTVDELAVRQCHLGNIRGTPDLQHGLTPPSRKHVSRRILKQQVENKLTAPPGCLVLFIIMLKIAMFRVFIHLVKQIQDLYSRKQYIILCEINVENLQEQERERRMNGQMHLQNHTYSYTW